MAGNTVHDGGCVSYFYRHCDQMPKNRNLKESYFSYSIVWRDLVYYGKEGLAMMGIEAGV